MLTEEQYRRFKEALSARGYCLVSSAAQYAEVTYFPNYYPKIREVSPSRLDRHSGFVSRLESGSQVSRRPVCHQGSHQVHQAPLARSLLCPERHWPGELRAHRREPETRAREDVLPGLRREGVCAAALSGRKSERIPHVRGVPALLLATTFADRLALPPAI